MNGERSGLDGHLAIIRTILEGAFFSPLHVNDWLGFTLGQPGLLDLEDDEVFDLFIRSAITAETIYPELAEGRTPLAWLSALEETQSVLAQVLASLRFDRPLLFHRTLFSLPAVIQGTVEPEEFELVEDFLQKALQKRNELRQAAAAERDTLYRRGLKSAGLEQAPSQVREWAHKVLQAPEADQMRSDAELNLWLSSGTPIADLPPDLAPAVMMEVWRCWTGAVLGVEPDLELLGRLLPNLNLDASELGLYAPPGRETDHVITAECPFCGTKAALRLGKEIEQQSGCSHLAFVGTSDEVHLLEVVSNFDLGADFKELLASYYQSPPDLELFATIVNDLFEMFVHQGRLEVRPVECETALRGFYFLQAYFAGEPQEPPPDKSTHH
jgi:hypothetical protein